MAIIFPRIAWHNRFCFYANLLEPSTKKARITRKKPFIAWEVYGGASVNAQYEILRKVILARGLIKTSFARQ